MEPRRTAAGALAGVAAGALAVAAWALLVEPRRTVVRRVELVLPAWPPALDGVRLGLLGDLHAGAPHVGVDRAARIGTALGRERPDVLLMAGDLVDREVAGATPIDPAAVAQALAFAAGDAPRFAVLGNHDRSFGAALVQRGLASAGFTVLADEAREVRTPRGTFWLAGVADEYSAEPRPAAALAAVPEGAPVVVLTHSPDVFPRIPGRVALTLAGHTHGGQVAAPGPLRARIIPSRFGARYAAGHVVEDGRHLFVTAGVGTSRWPIRLGVPAEVVVLTLRAAGT